MSCCLPFVTCHCLSAKKNA
ncbi:hypothetical protein VCCP104417_2224, partial [Vibrio cholerae CP1044(17)]